MEELEAQLAGKEQRLMTLVGELPGHTKLRDQLTKLETVVVGWVMTKWEVMKRKGEEALVGELPGHTKLRDQLTKLETVVVGWVMTKWEVMKRKGERRKRKRKKKRKQTLPKSGRRLLPLSPRYLVRQW